MRTISRSYYFRISFTHIYNGELEIKAKDADEAQALLRAIVLDRPGATNRGEESPDTVVINRCARVGPAPLDNYEEWD